MLQDSFSRKFYYLRMSITDACNFKCQYCLPDGYSCAQQPNYLRLDEIANLAQGFAKLGTNKIRITGGEPSLRKDLIEVIETCAATEGIRKLAITTNGFRLEKDAKRWRDAGLNAVNISMDSLDPRQFNSITGTQSFDKVMRGVEAAMDLDFDSIKLNAVLLKGVAEQDFIRYLDWLKQRPVEVRFIELMQMGEEQPGFFDKFHHSGEGLVSFLLKHGWEEQLRQHNAGPARVFCHPDYLGKVGLILPYSKDFCESCNRLRVSSTGKLHLCLFGEQGIDLREQLQSPNDFPELAQTVQAALADKKVSHFLHQGNTGATPHLASIGG